MDVFYTYTFGSAGWLAIQALPLLFSPSLIITLLSKEARNPTILEIYFCRSLAWTLLALALLIIQLTGSIPLTSSLADSFSDSFPEDPKAPYAIPTVLLTTFFHTLCTIYSYTYYAAYQTSNTAFLLAVIGYGSLAAMGGWCLLFGTEQGRIKRGGDKRVSGWPFRNVESERKRGKRKV